MLEHDLPGGREGERPSAPGALDQATAGQPFERGDLMADRGLDVAEAGRGATERPLARDGFERDKMAKLDARPPLARHAGCDAVSARSLGP